MFRPGLPFLISMLVSAGAWLIFVSGKPPAKRKPVETPLRVATYNIRLDLASDGANAWPNRKKMLAEQVNSWNVDLLGTQEVLFHQLKFLDSTLTGMDYVGGGRDDGKTAGEFSALFYATATFDLLDSETFWLSETPDKPSKGWDAALNRVCTRATLKHRASGKTVHVFNTHFDHIGQKARLESVNLILSKTELLRKSGAAVIVMGDFNLEPEAEPMLKLSATLSDARTAASKISESQSGTFNGFNAGKPASARIDYVFFNAPTIKAVSYSAPVLLQDGRYPSDHFPVLVEITF